MNCCENCKSQSVRKISSILKTEKRWGTVENTHVESTSDLASTLEMPVPSFFRLISDLFQYAMLSLIVGVVVTSIIGVILGPAGVGLGVLATMVLMASKEYEQFRLYLWKRRAYANRKDTYHNEWYCYSCDHVFVPGDPRTIRPATAANPD